MSSIKYNKAKKYSRVAKYPRMFDAMIDTIPDELWESLTSKQIAMIVDSVAYKNYQSGFDAGYSEGFDG